MQAPATASGGDGTGEDKVQDLLGTRLGWPQLRQRLDIEKGQEARDCGGGLRRVRIGGLTSCPSLIEGILKASGLYWRGRRNAEQVRVTHNAVASCSIPQAFDGFTLLHLSDLHVDMNEFAMMRVGKIVRGLDYDLCVLTGDYRGKMSGAYEASLAGMASIRAAIRGPIYGVLGDHDSIRMVPGLEAMGIRILLNECVAIERGGERLHLAGIDDAHLYHTDNIGKAAAGIPSDEFSILLSHTPEIYRRAAHAGFNLLLSGHTHGGQICLPGAIPITLDAALPRHMGSGAWTHHDMAGYTSVGAGSSVVPVRYNCPPEITLHHLHSTA